MKEKYNDFDSDVRSDGIQPINLATEVRNSFLDYAMSVIVSRALPDVRDGLKPVHRRIVYAMNTLGMTSAQPHKKSARIVGDVIAKYHPHGDTAVYYTMVRLAQDFASRYPLIDGHGNFGSVDGDSAAAMRYTEARMSKIAGEMVRDINKDTVDFIPNYDGEEIEPVILPARFPNLLANGSSGIAVGMATNIPPHNLGELIDTVLALSKDPDLSVVDIMTQYLPGPDFPTGGFILGKSGIKKAYETGNGSIVIRSRCEIEDMDRGGKKRIVVTEIPYLVNKVTMIEKIADLVKNKVVDGITDLRDESNREGIRVVIELRKDVIPEVILNQLFKYSSLQVTFGINMLALVKGEPKVLTVKEILLHYLDHQLVITRRKLQFELAKAVEREHLLQGLSIAIFHIDEVIAIIKDSSNGEQADQRLQDLLKLSERQSKAVLDMRLQRLTGMEKEKIELEITELQKSITEMNETLTNPEKLLSVVEQDLLEVKNRYSDARRTEFSNDSSFIEDEELIPEEQVIVTLTTNGYIKRVNADTYRSQNRGGKGIKSITTHDNDAVEKLLITSTHTDLMFFSNLGKVYRLRGHQVPEYTRQGKGLPIVNLLALEAGEIIQAIISVDCYDEDHQLMFVTEQGIVKRVSTLQFENIRQNGKIAVTLREGDRLLTVKKTTGKEEMLIAGSNGKMVRFAADDVRIMGRTATGVMGISLTDGIAVGASTSEDGEYILAVTANGYGKMSPRDQYRFTKRGGKGVLTVNATEKTGPLVAMRAVNGTEDLLVTTTQGILIRISLTQVKVAGRNTQGVRIIRLNEDQGVASIAVTEPEEIEETIAEVDATETLETNE